MCHGQRPGLPSISAGSFSFDTRDDAAGNEPTTATWCVRCSRSAIYFFGAATSALAVLLLCDVLDIGGRSAAADAVVGALLGVCLCALCMTRHYCSKLCSLALTSFLLSFLMYRLMNVDAWSSFLDSVIGASAGTCIFMSVTSHRSCGFFVRRRRNPHTPHAVRAANRQLLLSFLREQQQDLRSQAAPRSLIATLPTHVMTAAEAEAVPEECRVCTICIEDFQAGDKIQTLPCFHRFHKRCVGQWLLRNGVCPVCKHEVSGVHGDVV